MVVFCEVTGRANRVKQIFLAQTLHKDLDDMVPQTKHIPKFGHNARPSRESWIETSSEGSRIQQSAWSLNHTGAES